MRRILQQYEKSTHKELWQLGLLGLFLVSMFCLGMLGAMVTNEEPLGVTGEKVVQESVLAKAENWGLGFGEEGTVPTGMNTSEELAEYGAYYVGDTEEKKIYLTFDCGYELGYTEAILDALKKHNVKGTFFVVGHYLEESPELVCRMVEEGHTVANHSYNHPDMTSLSDEELIKELQTNADKFKELTGEEMINYYRPPQGKYTLENLKKIQELGYHTFFWSLAYMDWDVKKQPTHEEAFDKLLTRVHPGAIVLLHNTSQTNGEIMEELLTKWEEMGYTFGELSDVVR